MFLEEERASAKILQSKKHGDVQELKETQVQTAWVESREEGEIWCCCMKLKKRNPGHVLKTVGRHQVNPYVGTESTSRF